MYKGQVLNESLCSVTNFFLFSFHLYNNFSVFLLGFSRGFFRDWSSPQVLSKGHCSHSLSSLYLPPVCSPQCNRSADVIMSDPSVVPYRLQMELRPCVVSLLLDPASFIFRFYCQDQNSFICKKQTQFRIIRQYKTRSLELGGFRVGYPRVSGDTEHPLYFQIPNCPSVWILSHWQQIWIPAFGIKDFIGRLDFIVHRID